MSLKSARFECICEFTSTTCHSETEEVLYCAQCAKACRTDSAIRKCLLYIDLAPRVYYVYLHTVWCNLHSNSSANSGEKSARIFKSSQSRFLRSRTIDGALTALSYARWTSGAPGPVARRCM